MRKKRNKKIKNKNACKKTIVCKRIFVVSLLIFVTSLLVQMYIANATALKGKDFKELHQQKAKLEKETALLKYENSKLSRLENVEAKAFELGFEKMDGSIQAVPSPSLASLGSQ